MSRKEIVPFSTLVGKVLSKVEVVDKEEIKFYTSTGESYKLYHWQNCCEEVEIQEIVGDINDLVGVPILKAEEVSNEGNLEYGHTYTWTFYKLATIKGYVDIRWYGTSNGYYSEKADFVQEHVATG